MTFLLNVQLTHMDQAEPIRAWLKREVPEYAELDIVHVLLMNGRSFFCANIILEDEDIALTFRLTFSAAMGHERQRDEIMDHYINELAKTIQEEIDNQILDDLRKM